MYLAQNLKYLRERNGETQKDIAKILACVGYGYSEMTVSRYENGECEPELKKVIMLAEHFGVSIDDLLITDLRPPVPKYADNLRFCRKKYELTQEMIGKLIGVSQKEVSKYEKGEREIPIPKLLILSDYFGVTLDQLVKQDLSEEV